MGVETIGLALTALGAGAQQYNTKRAADSQERTALAGLRAQGRAQQDIDARVAQEVGALEGSSPEDERAEALDQFMRTLRSARSQTHGGDAPGGAQYGRDMAASRAGIDNYGQRLAGVLARIRGGVDQRRSERTGFARAASDVGASAREAQGAEFINKLRAANATRSPWLDAAGQMAQNAGAAMMGAVREDGPPALEPGLRRDPWGGAPSASSASGRLPVALQRDA